MHLFFFFMLCNFCKQQINICHTLSVWQNTSVRKAQTLSCRGTVVCVVVKFLRTLSDGNETCRIVTAQRYVVYCHMNLMTTLCLDILFKMFFTSLPQVVSIPYSTHFRN